MNKIKNSSIAILVLVIMGFFGHGNSAEAILFFKKKTPDKKPKVKALFKERQETFKDKDLIKVTREASYTVPPWFYDSKFLRTDDSDSQLIMYVNKWSEEKMDDSDEFFCANSFQELKKEAKFYLGELVSGKLSLNEDKKYLELIIDSSEDKSIKILDHFRAFRCDYISLNMKNKKNIGTLKIQPINATDVKELVEYLWLIKHYENLDTKVLSSFTSEEENDFVHKIYEVSLPLILDGACNKTTLNKLEFRVNKKSGNISFNTETLKEIDADCIPDLAQGAPF